MEGSWFLYIIVGILSGILSGTFGVGAGIIMIPALVFLDDFKQHDAQGVALAVMAPMALVGAWRYHANPDINLDFRITFFIAVGSLVGAVIGAQFAGAIGGLTLRRLFGIVMMIIAIRMLWTKS